MARKNGKQLQITGTGRGKDTIFKDIEEAATSYVNARDERMELTECEVAAQEKLVLAITAHNLATYQCDSEALTVEMIDKRKAKVRRRPEAEAP